eukprot:TRINITY_DN12068_c0_g1_i3.p1 TRINITY_DN12068_c0_g1~~TRINITY_DN12068_c0_g1_i3.p1  ORF type:complete len:108 (-),score=17.65 TRINITY_DN12068_c0_g1_i3:15-338(-)
MCIRDSDNCMSIRVVVQGAGTVRVSSEGVVSASFTREGALPWTVSLSSALPGARLSFEHKEACLLYTSDAADEEDSVDLGGRRITKKKNHTTISNTTIDNNQRINGQ